MDINQGGMFSPLSPMRLQASLGKEVKRMYKEGTNIVRISLARVVKINYKYNTVDVVTTLYKNTTIRNPNDNGRYSARLPVTMGGKTPNGKVYGATTLVTVGTLVLIGFLEGNKDYPIVLNVYGDADNQSQLTRTSLTSADESDESVQQELWQLFNLYPSMTYKNIDGRGNQEVTFSGKSFMYITDTDQENSYVNDSGFDYEHLPSAYYANGELIEPQSPNSPTVLYVHQGVYDDHRVTFFIKSDGTVRVGSRHLDGDGITFQQFNTDGSYVVQQSRGTTDPETTPVKFSKMEIDENGAIILQSGNAKLVVSEDGISVNGAPVSGIGGGGSGGGSGGGTGPFEINISDVKELSGILETINTSFTVQSGKIEAKISKTDIKVDTTKIDAEATKQKNDIINKVADIQTALTNLTDSINTAFANDAITTSENGDIGTKYSLLANAKKGLYLSYDLLYDSPYLTDSDKSPMDTAKTNYDNVHTSLFNTLDIVLMDNTVNASERTATSTAIGNYTAPLTSLQTVLNTVIDTIRNAKVLEAANDPVNYLTGEVTHQTSSITQLANEISERVTTETFTTAFANLDATKAPIDTVIDLGNQVGDAVQKLAYSVTIWSTNGNTFKNGDISTILFCTVKHGTEDITSTLPVSAFVWSRVSDDADADVAWNNSHTGLGSSLTITPADVPSRATFECDVTIASD
jgi:hypothetical protein